MLPVSPSTASTGPSEPPPLEGLADPDHEIAPWPDGFTEDAFRDHLDRLHARHMGDTIEAPRRDRLRSWRDRYLREAVDADRMAARLSFLCELAVAAPTPHDDEALRALVVEARRGVPRVHTTDTPDFEQERPMSANPQTITVSHPWLNPHLERLAAQTAVSTGSTEMPPRCA